jgi:hypothetical protein
MWPVGVELMGRLLALQEVGLLCCSSQTKAAQESVTKLIALAIGNIVTPKAGAKHELFFNKLASSLARGRFVVLLKSD